MISKNRFFLSLGSNLENKLDNLQNAVYEINEKIATVISCSPVYETPSWGFKGGDFYNICIEVNTSLTPEKLLSKLLALEIALGRKKKLRVGYENRCIDIDIILFENYIISTDNLIIPHPRALERLFVLLPLNDILKDFNFPTTNMKLEKCINACKDTSIIHKKDDVILF